MRPLPPGIALAVATPQAAKAAFAFGQAVTAETPFLHRLGPERARAPDELRAVFQEFADSPNSVLIHAWAGNRIVGEAGIQGGPFERIAHVGGLGIAVLKDHWGRGIGNALMLALEAFADRAGIARLELSVVDANTRARRLYRARGFVEEGIKRAAMRVDGAFVDEVLMAKYLDPAIRAGDDAPGTGAGP